MPTQILIALAMMVISYTITVLVTKPPKPQSPATLEDFEFEQSAEGTPQAVLFGDAWTDGWFVISYGGLSTQPIKVKSGK